jgi:hypothetical protein
MRVPWSRQEVPTPEPRPEPNTPRLLHLCDDGRLTIEPAGPQRAQPQSLNPDAVR